MNKYQNYEDIKYKTIGQLTYRNIANIDYLNMELETLKEGLSNLPDFSGVYTKDEIDNLLAEKVDLTQYNEDKANLETLLNQVKTRLETIELDYLKEEDKTELQSNIDDNASLISDNTTDIETNRGNIEINTTDIETNKGDITSNKSTIAINKANILTLSHLVIDINANYLGVITSPTGILTEGVQTDILFNNIKNTYGELIEIDTSSITFKEDLINQKIILRYEVEENGKEFQIDLYNGEELETTQTITSDNNIIEFSYLGNYQNGDILTFEITLLSGYLSATLNNGYIDINGATSSSASITSDKVLNTKEDYPTNGINPELIQVNTNQTDISSLKTGKMNGLNGTIDLNIAYFSRTEDGIYPLNFQNSGLTTDNKIGVSAINEINDKIEKDEILYSNGTGNGTITITTTSNFITIHSNGSTTENSDRFSEIGLSHRELNLTYYQSNDGFTIKRTGDNTYEINGINGSTIIRNIWGHN